jgi:acyl carrier protein
VIFTFGNCANFIRSLVVEFRRSNWWKTCTLFLTTYQVNGFCGKGFSCIGDAHRFIDPIFSFGLTVTMREGQFVAPIIRAYLEGANRDKPNPLVTTGILDSIAVLKVVTFLENQFGITIEPHEAVVENLNTLSDITRLVVLKSTAS